MLIVILIIGALLRFYNNTAVALWHDEAFSALYMRYPFAEMMQRITLDVHPPLYYLILRAWTYFAGQSLLSLRLLSIIFGVLTIWAGYLFVKAALHNRALALVATLLLALNPFQTQYSLEARMYTLGTFLLMWSSYFLVKSLDTNRKKYWLSYSLTMTATLYTHYYLFFSVAAQGLFVILYLLKRRDWKILINSAWAYALGVILYLPWLPIFNAQRARVESAYWIPAMDAWSIPGTIWKMVFGGTGIRNSILAISAIVAIVIIIYFLKRVSNFHKWLILLSIITPFAGAILLSMKTNIYLDRYFVFASLFFTILLAVVLYSLPRFALRWSAIILLASAVTFAFFQNWRELGIKNRPGMAVASQIVNLNAKPADKIYIGSSFIYFTFKYYNQTPIRPLLISDRPLKDIPHFSGTALLNDSDLILNFDKTAKGNTVWLLSTTGFGGRKTPAPKNWKQISESRFADSPGFKGSIFITEYKIN